MLLRCAGWGCERMISVSKAPGGNPVARADPEHFAVRFRICVDCHDNYCDRCLAGRGGLLRGPRCAGCGGKLVDGTRRQEVWSQEKAEPAVLHEEATKLGEQGQYTEALAVFDQVLCQRAGYPRAQFHRAITLRKLGRLTEAANGFAEAARLDPRNPQPLFDQANVLDQAGQREAALAVYERALRVQPRYLAALINKAVLLNALDRPADALAAAEAALQLEASGQAVDQGGSLRGYALGAQASALLRLERYEEALAALDTAISDGPDIPDNYRNRALALEKLGRAEEAEQAYRVYEDLRDE